MDSTTLIWIVVAFLAGVGCTLAYTRRQRPKPKSAVSPAPTADGLTADFRTTEAERQNMSKEYPLTYPLAAAGLLLVIGVVAGTGLFGREGVLTASDNGFFSNIYTEGASVLLTVFVIDRLNRRRDEQRTERELKAQLLRDVRSQAPGVALNAVHQLQERRWLQGEDSLLKGADLPGANLSGVDLFDANLSGADLQWANLSGANFLEADLSGAILFRADLSGAILFQANLSGADLWEANLSGANLFDANLSGADLQVATLDEAKFDEKAILPDETNWTPDADMTRFTDLLHPRFWRSDDPVSPAYRGDDAPPASQ